MDGTLNPIRIVGIDANESRGIDSGSAVQSIALELSTDAPGKWAEYFNDLWARHIYGMKSAANVSRNRLYITCVPADLEHQHLPELKKIVADTNNLYARLATDRMHQLDAATARKAAQENEIAELKRRIKFD
jgi:hypothetical protein